MRKQQLLKALFLLLIIISSTRGFAQNNFSYKGEIGKVNEDGFYKIALSANIIALSQASLADVRLKDNAGKIYPYITQSDLPHFSSNVFKEFKIITNTKQADKQTHIVIENITGNSINNLLLIVKNNLAQRKVTLSGSNDNKTWYVIKENIFLDNYFSSSEETFVQTLSFPLINYRFFQVTIIGENVLPVSIIKAGIYKEDYREGKYVALPFPQVLQKDSSNNKSYISLKWNEAYNVDKVELIVDGPKFYRREISISNDRGTVFPFVVSSNSVNAFPVNLKTKQWKIVIENGDNEPLKLKAVKAHQVNRYLLTWLEKDKTYTLFFGDSSAKAPVYDLAFFKGSINNNALELTVNHITKINSAVTTTLGELKLSKKVIWVVIVVVLGILLFSTLSMVKKIDAQKVKDN